MSSVDPRWPPPPELSHRPHRAAYVFAVLMPLVLVALLALPAGIGYGLLRWRASAGAAESQSIGSAAPDEGRPGLGDPYFPRYGNSGYDAIRYVVSLDWEPGEETLRGTAVMTAQATQPLRSFFVDLVLEPEQAHVGGEEADVERTSFSDVRITPAEPIAAGAEFSLTLTYAGSPGQIRSGSVAPWMRAGEEWLVAGQPESSAWWFPANDHPSDPALLEVSVRVPAGMEALSTGHLESTDTGQEPDFDTWHWVTRRPIPTYASFVSIGQYQLRRGTEDGRAFVYAVSEQLSATDREKAFAAMQTSAKTVRTLESMFGPYPPTTLGGIVPAHDLRFDGLETQGRPVYDRESIIDPRFSQVLVTHELAHMWFGNHVTLREWNDVFLNEAYASWAEWARAERSGGPSADEQLNGLYRRAKDRPEFWQVTMDDPRPDNLFTTVYARGPMTLQALRNVIGDEAFLGLARRWAKQPGPRSVEEWMVMAQASTRVDLVDFFHAWMLAPSAPAQTRANGLRP